MAKEVGLRETKLIQYLNEAYGKEKQLEQALTLHIKTTDVGPYKKKLQAHLKETKGHAREVQKRIKALGGKAEAVDLPGPPAVAEAASKVASAAGKAVAARAGRRARRARHEQGGAAPQAGEGRVQRRGPRDRELHVDRVAGRVAR